MVPALSIAAMVVTLALCFAIPVGGMLLLWRRHKRTWRAFWCGMLAFFLSQVMTRIPLMTLAVPQLPEPARSILLSVPVASYTAGLFEETGRLVVMVLLLKAFHRLVDGVAFGLGHGGLEAMLLVGLTYVNNLVIATMMNNGTWASVSGSLPAGQAEAITQAMTQTPWYAFGLAGIERVGAIGLHVACSLLVLAGIVHARKAVGWFAAIMLHGVTNWVVLSAVQAKVLPAVVIELLFVAAVAAILVVIVKKLGPTYPTTVE